MRGVETVAVASMPLTMGTVPPAKLAAVAWTREGDTSYLAVPVPSNVGATSMVIPLGFLGSEPTGSPLLWSCGSAAWSVPNWGGSASGSARRPGPPAVSSTLGAAAAAAAVGGDACAPDGSTLSDDDDDTEGGLRSRERDSEMEALRRPICTREGDTERVWRRTLSGLGAAMGSTAGACPADGERGGDGGTAVPESSPTALASARGPSVSFAGALAASLWAPAVRWLPAGGRTSVWAPSSSLSSVRRLAPGASGRPRGGVPVALCAVCRAAISQTMLLLLIYNNRNF